MPPLVSHETMPTWCGLPEDEDSTYKHQVPSIVEEGSEQMVRRKTCVPFALLMQLGFACGMLSWAAEPASQPASNWQVASLAASGLS